MGTFSIERALDSFTNGEHVFKYVLDKDFTYYNSRLEGIQYIGKWGSIINGHVRIKKNYAWDGCSPKRKLKNGWVIGTPDGWWDWTICQFRFDWTREASLVHDFLCQFHREIYQIVDEYAEAILITRELVDLIFFEILITLEYPLANLYYCAVRRFGQSSWDKQEQI